MTPTNPDIDFVISWVDGNDPELRKKQMQYTTSAHETDFEDIAGEERYVECGELMFCVASILRFASWANNIYIVTDNQIPPIKEFLRANFKPEEYADKIHIVDHTTIFRDYDSYLPVFNSLAIETMMWRIPGLSDKFIYMNDDVMLMRPTQPSDFFTPDGLPVCHGGSYPSIFARMLRLSKPRRHGHKTFGFKDSMLNAADMVNASWFPKISHSPHPLLRTRLEKIYSRHPEFVVHNIQHRFRDPKQYNPQALHYLCGVNELKSTHNQLLFLNNSNGKRDYVNRKLQEAEKMGENLTFACINSMSQLPDSDLKTLRDFLCRRIDINPDSLNTYDSDHKQ